MEFKVISTRQIAVFLISLVAAFLMVFAQHTGGLAATKLTSPVPQKIDTFINTIKPKLESKQNSFNIHTPTSLIPEAKASTEDDLVTAYGVIDFDSGELILQKNSQEKLPIASLTKVMTAVVALDLADTADTFTVTPKAAAQVPTKVMLKIGEKMSLEVLLKALLISSANDSAQVIKEGIDEKYNEQVFIRAMNEKARFLGLKGTNFTNPQGFDNPNHYSTVEDLAILSHYALTNYPEIAEIVKQSHEDLTQEIDERFYLRNWNGLLDVYPGVFGLKTGNTDTAGHTTLVVSERQGKKLLVVILGTPGVVERDLAAASALDKAFQEKFDLEPVEVTREELLAKYATWKY